MGVEGLRGRGEHRGDHLERRVKVVRSPGSMVKAIGDRIEFVLAVDRQIGALGQVLAQQAVGVLTGAALPGAVRIAEVNLHAGGGSEFAMAGHLLALVVGEALAQRCGNRVAFGSEAGQGEVSEILCAEVGIKSLSSWRR
jgi:hypothetical protein